MSHYYSKEQKSPLQLKQIEVVVDGRDYSFYSGSGVFSKNKLDFGTKVLGKYMQVGPKETVLDLGCGIGIIGYVAAQKTKNDVVFTDINKRAVKLAKMNTKKLKNAIVVQGDKYEAVKGMKFDVILLNPPQTAGKKVCLEMIEDAKKYLNDNGSLQIVARHNKGGETLSKFMEKIYGNMETLAKKGGYRVYKSVKE
jgi:16S rRNA (guanine1207-N2)-methyltransferase